MKHLYPIIINFVNAGVVDNPQTGSQEPSGIDELNIETKDIVIIILIMIIIIIGIILFLKWATKKNNK